LLNKSGPGADVPVAKVATLSEHAFDASPSRLHEDNERYHAKLNEDWSQGAERWNVEREAEEGGKRKARELPLEEEEEEAPQLAFQMPIEECQMLIDYFSGVPRVAPWDTQPTSAGKLVAAAGPGFLPQFEKSADSSDEEEDYFHWKTSRSSTIDLPKSTFSALRSLSIRPPSSQADVPRVIEDLKVKKARLKAFEVNPPDSAMAEDPESPTPTSVKRKSTPTTPSRPEASLRPKKHKAK